MSRFYASIQGNKSEATRCGHATSGIVGHVRGWENGICINGYADGDVDCFEVYASKGSNHRDKDIRLGLLRDGVWYPAEKTGAT